MNRPYHDYQEAPPMDMPSMYSDYGNAASNASGVSRPSWFLQLNAYGGKCAFQCETAQTKDGWHTLNIESAPKENPNDRNNKRFNWKQKVVIQLTRTELPIFCAVMLGMLESARFDNHGDQNKWLEVANQNTNFLMKSGGGNLPMNIAPVTTVDAFMFGTMAIAAYARNFEGMSTQTATEIVGRMAAQIGQFGTGRVGGYKPATARG